MITNLSPDWPALRAWLDAREAEAINALLNPTCDVREADQLRGRIAEIRHLIATVEKPPVEQPIAPTKDPSGY